MKITITAIENAEVLFDIRDGDYLQLKRPDGEIQVRKCKVIDPLHVRVGAFSFHKDELIPRMNQLNVDVSLATNIEIACDYMITDKMIIGDKAIVIGHNPEAVQPYVTWMARAGHSDYAWGHYYNNKRSANKDYAHRIFDERQYQKIRSS